MIEVNSDRVIYTEDFITTRYVYQSTQVETLSGGSIRATPIQNELYFKTVRHPARTGVMLIGWGGNNGSTMTAGVIANKLGITWRTKRGNQSSNYYGSITQASTVRIGHGPNLEDVFVPMNRILPMVSPNDLVIGGWDCSSLNLADAMLRSQVLDVTLQDLLVPHMTMLCPLPAIFDEDFVATNQKDRADNVLRYETKQEAINMVRQNIRAFKQSHQLDTVIVLWTANTERLSKWLPNIHDTADNLLHALSLDERELAPSLLYAIASVLEGCSYINGAPHNTICPALTELAERHGVFLGGDDFKSGQTKLKSSLVEMLVNAGIKPECIASYNHLGNNDGKNLNEPAQFQSKEKSKTNVIDDIVASNRILYPDSSSKPDHCVVIKYLPYIGDSKRAIDEYVSSIFMGGDQTISIHNICQDSLLATPLMIDLVVLTELMQRVSIAVVENGVPKYERIDSVLSLLSYMMKSPNVPKGAPVVNALSRQRESVENTLRALVGLSPEHNMMLNCSVPKLRKLANIL